MAKSDVLIRLTYLLLKYYSENRLNKFKLRATFESINIQRWNLAKSDNSDTFNISTFEIFIVKNPLPPHHYKLSIGPHITAKLMITTITNTKTCESK